MPEESLLTVSKVVAGVALAGIAVALLHPSHKLPGAWGYASDALGFSYTAAWSISFYPQLLLNFRLKSVSGLSIEFQVLNMLGFSCYAAYNVSLFYIPFIQNEYRAIYGDNIPVGFEDVLFSVHAAIITALTLLQCFLYDRGGQRFCTPIGKGAGVATLAILVGTAVVALAEDKGIHAAHPESLWLSWMGLLLGLSTIKLIVSLIKYIPQVLLNFRRKSTVGWSIINVLLDFLGGTLSLIQLLMQCWVLKDWTQIAGNPVKFGLGFVSLSFDILFMIQHFVLFPVAAVATTAEAAEASAVNGVVEERQQSDTVALLGADDDGGDGNECSM